MIDHLGINCADYARSQEFYATVLGIPGGSAMGPNRAPTSRSRPPTRTRCALSVRPRWGWAKSRCMGRGFGLKYHPGYFGAFVRDPDGNDGNDVEAVWYGGP